LTVSLGDNQNGGAVRWRLIVLPAAYLLLQKAEVLLRDTFLLPILRIYTILGKLPTNQILTRCIGNFFISYEMNSVFMMGQYYISAQWTTFTNDDSMKEKISVKRKYPQF
jgi:hypothetical protein